MRSTDLADPWGRGVYRLPICQRGKAGGLEQLRLRLLPIPGNVIGWSPYWSLDTTECVKEQSLYWLPVSMILAHQ